MMVKPDLDRCLCNLPWSASGFPSPRADCCRLTPNRPNSLIQASEFVACRGCIGINFLRSGTLIPLAAPITKVGLGIKSP